MDKRSRNSVLLSLENFVLHHAVTLFGPASSIFMSGPAMRISGCCNRCKDYPVLKEVEGVRAKGAGIYCVGRA